MLYSKSPAAIFHFRLSDNEGNVFNKIIETTAGYEYAFDHLTEKYPDFEVELTDEEPATD